MNIQQATAILQKKQFTWLITGVAGFIGSNLLENLLLFNQKVVGLDNFSTGFQENLDDVRACVGEKAWQNFTMIQGDIRSIEDCHLACHNIDYVLHHAALGSVPRSIVAPIGTHQNNIDGFLNILIAARDANVKKFIFASSSSVYGDNPNLPKKEGEIGQALSPYALTKYVNELYAEIFKKVYQLDYIGFRYFNVFGKRQNPEGNYAAVIPKWVNAMLNQDDIYINGDGQISRDFCYIENVVQANILAALSTNPDASNRIYNVACHQSTTLNELFELINFFLKENHENYTKSVIYREERQGDVRYSLASIDAIKTYLNYIPSVDIKSGMAQLVKWTLNHKKMKALIYEQ